MQEEKLKVRTIADIKAIEKTLINEKMKFFNTYDMLKNGAAINPDSTAISFFLTGDSYASPQRTSYRDFFPGLPRRPTSSTIWA